MSRSNRIGYDRFAGLLYFVFPVLLMLMACSTTTPAPKPQETAMQPKQQASSAKKPVNLAVASSGSSLEAHREGKTPTVGPLKDIYFDFDKYDLRADARELLKTHSDWLRKNASAQVQIEGHCDDRGSGEYNLALGAKRAQAAKDYLVTSGIPAGRITTISYGKELPVCHEETEECWQRNRHDRFVVKNLPTT